MTLERKLILVDAYGGDDLNGVSVPARMVPAVLAVATTHPQYQFMLVGNPAEIEKYKKANMPNVSIEPGRGQSYRAITRIGELVEERRAQVAGVYTLADNREVVTIVTKHIGVLPEASALFPDEKRIISPLIAEVPKSPTITRARTCYLLDAGAAPELTTPEQYRFYARLGIHYAEIIGGRENPTVGLFNVGAEAGKGSPLLRETYALLNKSGLNFIGNVEPFACVNDREKGSDTPRPVDVVIASGEMGNNFIKSLATGGDLVGQFISYEMESGNILARCIKKAVAALLLPVFKRVKTRMDPSRTGGAYFACGVIPVTKSHGTATTDGNIAGLEKTIWFIENNVPEIMRTIFKKVQRQAA